MDKSPDVLVVGGGPAGSASAYWLGRAGRSVVLVERKAYPRQKTCGDGLTPRSIRELHDLGFDLGAAGLHRTTGLRLSAGARTLEVAWPTHPDYPDWGGVIRRADLDERLARLVGRQGVTIVEETEARPVLDGGRVKSVELSQDGATGRVDPRMVVVTDGAVSRFGRRLGPRRDRRRPMGQSARTYYPSPKSDEPLLDLRFGIPNGEGTAVPGYGWVFPLGDGTVNVGVILLSTYRRWKGERPFPLMDHFVEQAGADWAFNGETSLSRYRGGMLPAGLSVAPLAGPNWVIAGDAAGMINPFTGEGIAYALETGRLAAGAVDRALFAGESGPLEEYPVALEREFGLYYRTGEAFVRLITRPAALRVASRVTFRARPLLEWALRIMTNMLAPEERKMGNRAYRLLAGIASRFTA